MTPQSLEDFMGAIQRRDPGQPEFLQAVREVVISLWPFLEKNPRYREYGVLERLCEPDRAIQFRVAWVDDKQLRDIRLLRMEPDEHGARVVVEFWEIVREPIAPELFAGVA